ncbi:hypothetical protein P5P86_14565 [Nocardioides sp. BP30]|uniref:hypothetical protein n=1 Tax=Nocardioides sp. BP30 TaxID=3036374 RepID=UPI0024698C50|nr:hypothetical protein [Nocardioides sp. BP30]WGL51182.1 hypothetical protein P5P86_14565 [Nocardioides sp. BP30]
MRIVLMPGCLALLPEYASLNDPVADLRRAVLEAVSWLGEEVEIIGTEQGRRVAASALAARPRVAADTGEERSVLVVANGSACRTERAPGFLDPRAEAFDSDLGAALREPSAAALGAVDRRLAEELWADVAALPELAALLAEARTVAVDHDVAPYGVQYWVVRWEA